MIQVEFSVRLTDYLGLNMWEPLASRWLLEPRRWVRSPERKEDRPGTRPQGTPAFKKAGKRREPRRKKKVREMVGQPREKGVLEADGRDYFKRKVLS